MIMNDIINLIKKNNNIGIAFHESPDGDAIGSALALLMALRSEGKNVYLMSKDVVPKSFTFLECSSEINGEIHAVKEETQLVIALDCGNTERLSFDYKEERDYVLINIDHHLSNDLYGDFNYVDTNCAAVSELVYQLIKCMGITITKSMAECIYTSLLTDTGSFRHSNTTSITHAIAGDMINYGINFSKIHRTIFENKTINQIKLQGKVIDNMYLTCNNKVCVMKLTQNMLEECKVEEGDTSYIVSLGTQIKGVETTILLKEKKDTDLIKVSLRSKEKVDVRAIAESFGGGGHIRAAGFASNDTISCIEFKLIEMIQKELIS